MAFVTVLTNGLSLYSPNLTVPTNYFKLRPLNHSTSSCSLSFTAPHRMFPDGSKNLLTSRLFWLSSFRIKSSRREDAENDKPVKPEDTQDGQDMFVDEILENRKIEATSSGSSFLAMLAIALGVAVTITIISVGLKTTTNLGPSFGIQCLAEGSSSSSVMASPAGFSFKAFGYKFVLPEYAPGWIYFWLLMAAGCGLFISEEALNIWVCPLYWGVCISDMIPFYLGKLFRQSGASDDVCSRLGISKEKALSVTRAVQKYGNLIGFVERFSLGVRNPTAFLAGTLGLSPDCFFAGVCCGGLITLPIQLVIGFLLRERPVFALATVATAVGIWTVFPYAVAASTALFLYLQRRYST